MSFTLRTLLWRINDDDDDDDENFKYLDQKMQSHYNVAVRSCFTEAKLSDQTMFITLACDFCRHAYI